MTNDEETYKRLVKELLASHENLIRADAALLAHDAEHKAGLTSDHKCSEAWSMVAFAYNRVGTACQEVAMYFVRAENMS